MRRPDGGCYTRSRLRGASRATALLTRHLKPDLGWSGPYGGVGVETKGHLMIRGRIDFDGGRGSAEAFETEGRSEPDFRFRASFCPGRLDVWPSSPGPGSRRRPRTDNAREGSSRLTEAFHTPAPLSVRKLARRPPLARRPGIPPGGSAGQGSGDEGIWSQCRRVTRPRGPHADRAGEAAWAPAWFCPSSSEPRSAS